MADKGTTGISGVERLSVAALCVEASDEEVFAQLERLTGIFLCGYAIKTVNPAEELDKDLYETLAWIDGLVQEGLRRLRPPTH